MKNAAIIPRVCRSAWLAFIGQHFQLPLPVSSRTSLTRFEMNFFRGFEDDDHNSTIWLSDLYVMSKMSRNDRTLSGSLAPMTAAINPSCCRVNFLRAASLLLDITGLSQCMQWPNMTER